MAGHDAVVHFAAESHVDRSIAGPEGFAHDQLRGHQPRDARGRAAGIERVVHISTDEVYGSVEQGASLRVRPAGAAFAVFRLEGRVGPDRPVVLTRPTACR